MINKSNKIWILIALLIIFSSCLIYLENNIGSSGYLFSRYLFILPIALAGIFYGTGAGIFSSLVATFSFAPIILIEIESGGLSYKSADYFLTIIIFFAIAIISGLFFQKSNSIKKFYHSLYRIEKVFNDTNGMDEVLNEINEIFLSQTAFFISHKNDLFSIISRCRNGEVQEIKNVRLEKNSLLYQLMLNKKDFTSSNIQFDSRISNPDYNFKDPFCFLSIVPVIYLNNILGLLAIETNGRLPREDLLLLKRIAGNLALTFQNKQLYNFAVTDKLTKILNRRYFDIYFANQIHQHPEQNLHLLILDIDFFKRVNDSFGHPKGDEILIKTANLIRKLSYPCLAFRIGGEEFAVLIKEEEERKVLEIAETIRSAYQKNIFYSMPDRSLLTISIGIASYPKDSRNTEELFAKADQALYRAKENGRNRVEIYS